MTHLPDARTRSTTPARLIELLGLDGIRAESIMLEAVPVGLDPRAEGPVIAG